jgi:hypothetical protein
VNNQPPQPAPSNSRYRPVRPSAEGIDRPEQSVPLHAARVATSAAAVDTGRALATVTETSLTRPDGDAREQWREAQRASDGGGARRGSEDDNVSISGSELCFHVVHANWTRRWWQQGWRRKAEQAGDGGATFTSCDLLSGKALSSFLRFCYSWILPPSQRR